MRLADFLILMLRAHGETLQELADFLGEDVLFEILERLSDDDVPPPIPPGIVARIRTDLTAVRSGNAYEELQHAVSQIKLRATLQFHVWAYPHYRTFIESPFDLDSQLENRDGSTDFPLAEEAIHQAKLWIERIPGPAPLRAKLLKISEGPWLRFRTQVFSRAGKHRLGIAP